MVALGAPFLYYHFALASALAEPPACLVLVQPVLVLAHGELGLDDFACELSEAQLAAADLAVDAGVDGLELDQPTADGAEIALEGLAVHC